VQAYTINYIGLVVDAIGNVGIGTNSPSVSLDAGSSTDAMLVPKGTTAQRPTLASGMIRYNTTNNAMEVSQGSTAAWGAMTARFVSVYTTGNGGTAGVPTNYGCGSTLAANDGLGTGTTAITCGSAGTAATTTKFKGVITSTAGFVATTNGVTRATTPGVYTVTYTGAQPSVCTGSTYNPTTAILSTNSVAQVGAITSTTITVYTGVGGGSSALTGADIPFTLICY
jgi:hypothetical protein